MRADAQRGRQHRGKDRGGLAAWLVGPVRRVLRPFLPRGLSARLLVITIFVVLLSEVLIYVPSIASHRTELMLQRLDAAQIAALAIEAAENNQVGAALSDELLANAGVISVVLKRNDERSLFLRPGEVPPVPIERFDLEHQNFLMAAADAFKLLLRGEDRIISVRGVPRLKGGIYIEAVMREAPLRAAMIDYSGNFFEISILVSLLTAASVFGAINILLVGPMKRIERSMTRFRRAPEDANAVIEPSERRDEIGSAERELAAMQADLRVALRERARLAALGMAVSKINHDLRNMLSSAQLFVDRLEKSEDPQVQRLAPKLVAAIGRAVALCTNTLRYGRAEEQPPEPQKFDLYKLAEDVGANALASGEGLSSWKNRIPEGMAIIADPDQIFRVLYNLTHNAAQAIDVAQRRGEITVEAFKDQGNVHIDVRDTGPGIPEAARARLFEPFTSVQRAGGTGLGLAIAAELVGAYGGTLRLVTTGPGGTVFRIALPQPR